MLCFCRGLAFHRYLPLVALLELDYHIPDSLWFRLRDVVACNVVLYLYFDGAFKLQQLQLLFSCWWALDSGHTDISNVLMITISGSVTTRNFRLLRSMLADWFCLYLLYRRWDSNISAHAFALFRTEVMFSHTFSWTELMFCICFSDVFIWNKEIL